ncbi:hypothetical protein HX866_01160 [Pseudomonas gingeri]|uniref:DUF6124 family protein n=1 Tax=Pseudomonas gingeri TaxID=117681 RepID=UPI0015A36569|nr:hypothetical protein [Pseudomonas gingeri]NWA23490.1 hypothetical protein [Pseudomonas gingeri]NWD78430.1 hypothetical protein [Pseudomonas gingeri]
MFKITPNPPCAEDLNSPAFKLAAERALAHYELLPSQNRPRKTPARSTEDTLVHIYELLQCASATAYESADNLQGPQRKLALGAVHLIDMAQQEMDELLDGQSVAIA